MKALMSSVTSGLRLAEHFANASRGTQADVALRSFRVPRPCTAYSRAWPLAQMRTASATADACASSFTYRNGAPHRPESTSAVGTQMSSVIAHQPCRQPRAVGWMFPVGKGGARFSGRGTRTETSAPLTSASTQTCKQTQARKAQARHNRFETGMNAKTTFTWSKQ